MKTRYSLLGLAVMAALSSAAQAQVAIDVIGGSEITFEGLVQTDMDWYSEDLSSPVFDNDIKDGDSADYNLRRAELILKGKGPGMWNWVLGYDAFANKFLDANVAYRMGDNFFTVGQYKQPNSLEELTSTKNNDFQSKAMTTNLFAVARRVGASYAYLGQNFGGSASIYGNELTPNESPSLGTGNGFGVRGYYAPINSDAHFLHFGLSYIDMDVRNSSDQEIARLRVRPDADLSAARLIDTGNFSAESLSVFGIETAYVQGPFKFQGEYMDNTFSRPTGFADFNANSFYAYGVWNITGETWGYKTGLITTPLPNNPSLGMWQVGIRYDNANLNDGKVDYTIPTAPVVTGILGGEEDNWTLGVNWYWRSNFKVQLNYVMVSSSRYNTTAKAVVDNNPDITTLRLQFYW
jgi:phosphate-selective porin OprO/OprP